MSQIMGLDGERNKFRLAIHLKNHSIFYYKYYENNNVYT